MGEMIEYFISPGFWGNVWGHIGVDFLSHANKWEQDKQDKGLHVTINHSTDSYYANPSGPLIFAHVTPRSLWAFCGFPFLLYKKRRKKSVSIFIALWFISFSLKSPGTLKELVGLNVSWNVWGWWELCFVNLSPKPSDAHHAAEGEVVCESGWSHIRRIVSLLQGEIYLLVKL